MKMTIHETTLIREPVEVIALFDCGMSPLRPLRFRWKGRVFRVRHITFTWSTMDGSAPVIHFSVHDGATLYELSYNKSTMKWTLEGVALP